MPRAINAELTEFILRSIRDGAEDVGSIAAKQFGVSRTTVSNYIFRLVKEGHLKVSGKTKARKFVLKPFLVGGEKDFPIIRGVTQEDVAWRDVILPHTNGLNRNVIDICQH